MPSGRLQSGASRPCQSEALHLVSGPFATPLFGASREDAVVAQLVRAPVCGTGGRWFEPTQLYHIEINRKIGLSVLALEGRRWPPCDVGQHRGTNFAVSSTL